MLLLLPLRKQSLFLADDCQLKVNNLVNIIVNVIVTGKMPVLLSISLKSILTITPYSLLPLLARNLR